MNTPMNARSTASKMAICNAMLDLLNEKELEKISVQELVERAGINRSTFYAHYLDIKDLLQKIECEMVAPISTDLYMVSATADSIFSAKALIDLVAYFRTNQAFYKVFFAASSKSKIIQETATYVMHRIIEPYLEKSNQFTQQEYIFQFEFCMAGFLGVISKWLQGHCVEPDNVVAGVLKKLIWKCLT